MKIEKVSLILGEEAALRQQLQRDRLAVWLTELEQEQGPIEAQVIEEVRQAWPAPEEKIVRRRSARANRREAKHYVENF
jgi:hypothetical protein